MTASVRRVTQGDTFPSLLARFTYADTSLVLSDDIDAGLDVTFSMRAVDLATPTIDEQPAVLVSSTGGVVTLRYDWASGDTDRIGEYRAQFRIDTGGGSFASFPSGSHLRILIIDDQQ